MVSSITPNSSYSNDQINRFFKCFFPKESSVKAFTALPANALYDNMVAFSKKRFAKIQQHQRVKSRVVIPIFVNQNHWTLLFIRFEEGGKTPQHISYIDPKGNPLPNTVEDSLKILYPKTSIVPLGETLQYDNDDCGPMVVESARRLIRSDQLPSVDFDVQQARGVHQQILDAKPGSQKLLALKKREPILDFYYVFSNDSLFKLSKEGVLEDAYTLFGMTKEIWVDRVLDSLKDPKQREQITKEILNLFPQNSYQQLVDQELKILRDERKKLLDNLTIATGKKQSKESVLQYLRNHPEERKKHKALCRRFIEINIDELKLSQGDLTVSSAKKILESPLFLLVAGKLASKNIILWRQNKKRSLQVDWIGETKTAKETESIHLLELGSKIYLMKSSPAEELTVPIKISPSDEKHLRGFYRWINCKQKKNFDRHRPFFSKLMHHINRLKIEGKKLVEHGKFREALHQFHYAYALIQRLFAGDPKEKYREYSKILDGIAALEGSFSKHNICLDLHLQTFAIKSRYYSSDHQSIAGTISSIATALQRLHYLDLAVQLYDEILPNFSEKDTIDYANYLNDYGNALRNKGDAKGAIEKYSEALSVMKKKLGDSHLEVAMCQTNLMTAISDLGRYSEALFHIEKAVEIYEQQTESSREYVRALNNLGFIHLKMVKFELAGKVFIKALHLCKEFYSDGNETYADVLTNLGVLHSYQGKYHEALKLHHSSYQMNLKIFGENNPEIARNFDNIAKVYDDQDKADEAYRVRYRALKIYIRYYGSSHPEVARVMGNLAISCVKLRRDAEAIQWHKSSQEIYLQLYGTNHPDYARTVGNLAIAFMYVGSLQYALKLNAQAIEIFKALKSSKSINLVANLDARSLIYSKMGRHQEALAVSEEALDYAKTMDRSSSLWFTLMEAHAYRLIQVGLREVDEKKAMSFFEKAREKLAELLKTDTSLIESHQSKIEEYDLIGNTRLLKRFAYVCHLLGRFKEAGNVYFNWGETLAKQYPTTALDYIRKSYHILKKVKGEERHCFEILLCQAKIYHRQGRLSSAVHTIKKALRCVASPKANKVLTKWESELNMIKQKVDPDLWAQYERAVETRHEVKRLYLRDLMERPYADRGKSLSEEAKNRTTEVIIKFRNILDQCYRRFICDCIYHKNQSSRVGGEVYFPFGSSKDALKNQLQRIEVYASSFKLSKQSFKISTPKNLIGEILDELRKHGYLDSKGCLSKKFDPKNPTLFSEFAPLYIPYLKPLRELLNRSKPGIPITRAVIADRGKGIVKVISPPESETVFQAFKNKDYLQPFKAASGNIDPNAWALSSKCRMGDPHFKLDLGPDFPLFEAQLLQQLKRASLTDYPQCEQVILSHQPFAYYRESKNQSEDYWKLSWLDKITYIGNDSKHVRLTPQRISENLAEQFGSVKVQKLKILIEYVESDLFTWTFVPHFGEQLPNHKKIALSRKIFNRLKDPKVGVIAENKGRRHVIHPIVMQIVQTPMDQTQKINKLVRQFNEKLRKHLPDIATSHISTVADVLICRAMQQAYILRVPDAFVDVDTLMDNALKGTKEILEALCSVRTPRSVQSKKDPVTVRLDQKDLEIKTWKDQPLSFKDVQIRHSALKELTKQDKFKDPRGRGRVLHLYLETAKHLESTYPFLSLAYYQKVFKDMVRLSSCRWEVVSVAHRIRAFLTTIGLHEKGFALFEEYNEYRCDVKVGKILEDEQKAYRAKHSYIDKDILSQVAHLEGSLQNLKYACFKSTVNPIHPSLSIQIHNQIIEMVIKIHHLLDQSYTRFTNALIVDPSNKRQMHFPCTGSEDSLMVKLADEGLMNSKKRSMNEYPLLMKKLIAAQPFQRESWWSRIYALSIEGKHIRMQLSAGENLTNKGSFKERYHMRFSPNRFFSWSFKEFGSLKLSKEIYQRLAEKHYLSWHKMNKTKKVVCHSKATIKTTGKIEHKSPPLHLEAYVKVLREKAPDKELLNRRKDAFDHLEKTLKGIKLTDQNIEKILDQLVYFLKRAKGDSATQSGQWIPILENLEEAIKETRSLVEAFYVAVKKDRKQEAQPTISFIRPVY